MIKRIAIFNAALLLWYLHLTLIWWSHQGYSDLYKSRAYSLISNAIAIVVLLSMFYIFYKHKPIRKAIVVSSAFWGLTIVILCYQVFMAIFWEPPFEYIEKKARLSGMSEGNIIKTIHGPAGSAIGEYENWMYNWRVFGECIFDCS